MNESVWELHCDLLGNSSGMVPMSSSCGELSAWRVAPEDPGSRIQQHKQKEKTRPPHSSTYEITPVSTFTYPSGEQPSESQYLFQVEGSTLAVFSSLLSRSSEPRCSISWDTFMAATGDIGFSMIPKFGSIYTSAAPSTLAAQRNLTLHHPHKSRIEIPTFLSHSRRPNRICGWNESRSSEI
jgi:hypothetical protein